MTTHQVRQARFRLRTGKAPERAERAAWQSLFETRYLPLIEQALDAWAARHPEFAAQTLVMPRLQLDLGPLRAAADDDSLLLSLQRQLDAQLQGQIALSVTDWALHCHLHFLRSGSWPTGSPWTSLSAAQDWWRRHPALLPRLRARLAHSLNHETLWLRLCLQHDAAFLVWLCGQAAEGAGADRGLLATWRLWTQLHAAPGVPPSAARLTELRGALAAESGRAPTAIGSQELLRAAQRQAGLQQYNDPADSGLAEGEADSDAALRAETSGSALSLLVQQAGLVLLHPWLPALFRQLGLLRGEHFPDSDSRLRAIFALHFAATGRQAADEGELALHKQLVGWPAGQPLPASEALSSAQRDEIEALLRAVIGHWKVLKNTSVAGLREAFLQRPGTLRRDADAWQLHVAAQSIDLLLDHLPWSIGLVRLPWLPAPLHVVWTRT